MPLIPIADECPKDKEYLAPCPCFSKEDGDYLCLNSGTIRDIIFVDLLCCKEAPEASIDNPVCMNCLYVQANKLYCATTHQPLTIYKKHVNVKQFRNALNSILVWLPKSQPQSSADICSPCLYRAIHSEIESDMQNEMKK